MRTILKSLTITTKMKFHTGFNMGILEQIRQAKSVFEVALLLAKGSGHGDASADTKRKRRRAAAIRIEALEKEKQTPYVFEVRHAP